MEQFAKASDSVLKPIVIGFLLGFTAVGATRLGQPQRLLTPASLLPRMHPPQAPFVRHPGGRLRSGVTATVPPEGSSAR